MKMSESFGITHREIQITKIENAWQGELSKKKIPFSAPRRFHGLLYIISGECDYFFRDKSSFSVNSGDVFYLARGSKYDMDVRSERYSFIAINFLAEDEGVSFVSENFGKIPESEKAFCRASEIWSKKGNGYLTETLISLCEIYLGVIKSTQKEYIGSKMKEKIVSACEYMAERRADCSLTVSGVAQYVGLSPAYFRRLFVKYKGVSPQTYLINLKIDRAKELLALEWLSISEVAEQSGFVDFCYFSRIFKKYTGMSPKSYRKRFFQ